MKACLLILMVVFSFACLLAENIDDNISSLLRTGSFIDHNGGRYFIPDCSNLPSEQTAMESVAVASLVFLLVQKHWVDYTSSGDTSNINTSDYVACPYDSGDESYLLRVSMADLKSDAVDSDFEGLDQDECMQYMMRLVDSNSERLNYYNWKHE